MSRDVPSWVGDMRAEAARRYASSSMPDQSDEAWRYVEIDFDVRDFDIIEATGQPLSSSELVWYDGHAGLAKLVDGRAIEAETEAPIGFGSLDAALSDPASNLQGSYAASEAQEDIFGAAHRANSTDGVFVDVPEGVVVDAPLVIEIQATQAGSVSYPHVNVRLGANSEATVIVIQRSIDEQLVVVSETEMQIGDGARLRLMGVQDWGSETRAVNRQAVDIGRDATVRLGDVGLGGRLSRLDMAVELIGSGSAVTVDGLFFGDGIQQFDYRMVINHRGVSTSSNVFLKGAVEDKAQSVFSGLLRIWEDAVKSSAFETNRNLVLSEEAKAHSVPNLEILCDDVICGHGSTVGPLDEEPLYYLESRGLPPDRAARLLVNGFFEEAISRLPVASVGDAARSEVRRKFVEAQREGRLA